MPLCPRRCIVHNNDHGLETRLRFLTGNKDGARQDLSSFAKGNWEELACY
jgi:hypothetical protein